MLAWSHDSVAVGVDHDQLDRVRRSARSHHLVGRSVDCVERLRGGRVLTDQRGFCRDMSPPRLDDSKWSWTRHLPFLDR